MRGSCVQEEHRLLAFTHTQEREKLQVPIRLSAVHLFDETCERSLCVCACVLAVYCEIRHLVSWSLCCPSTQHNRPLFTAPPTAIKHACLSVTVYVCVIISSIPAFSFFSPEAKFKRFLSVEELLFSSFSLFLITSLLLPPPSCLLS